MPAVTHHNPVVKQNQLAPAVAPHIRTSEPYCMSMCMSMDDSAFTCIRIVTQTSAHISLTDFESIDAATDLNIAENVTESWQTKTL